VGLPLKGLSQRVLPQLDESTRTAALLMSAMPMMGTYIVLAQLYGKEDISAAALLMTTAASFFTLSALLWVLKPTLT
jgi:predicted permease